MFRCQHDIRLRYRRGTARRAMTLEMSPTAAKLYEKSHSRTWAMGDWLKKQVGSFHMWTSVWIWQVKLCDPSLTRANLSALEMSIAHVIKRYTSTVYLLIPEIVRQM